MPNPVEHNPADILHDEKLGSKPRNMSEEMTYEIVPWIVDVAFSNRAEALARRAANHTVWLTFCKI
jgi:hypothetical protein